jgi:hypothetical protein
MCFHSVELPALDDVKGAFTLISTTDITNSCNAFSPKKPTAQGGNGHFQGTFTCRGNDASANNGGNSTSGGTSNSTGAAAGFDYSMPVVLGMAVLGGLAQAM